jgi:Arc/MetJ-type ribon-helix-helix transcriptional regulator
MGFLNVRLSDEDAHLVRELKKRGVSISDVVRAAIRASAAHAVVPEDTGAILKEMFHRFPETAKPPALDATDRHAVRRLIRRKLRRAGA